MKDTAYRVLIVDDDEEVRSGLTEIVDWKRCGFRVAAVLKDGAEAIPYLAEHQVDVVLSDIRMTFMSGLEVAKHIYEHRIPAKIVLISGHQEFELAKEALRYNVQEYLLKPTDLDEVYRVFGVLKEQLDEERAALNRLAMDKEMWSQMMRYLKERYLPHLLFDTHADEEEIRRQFEMIGLNIDPKTCACAPVRISWPSASPPDAVQRALLRSLSEHVSSVALLPFEQASNPLMMLAICVDTERCELAGEIDRMLSQAASRLRTLLGLAIEWQADSESRGLSEFLEEHRTLRLQTNPLPNARLQQWKAEKQRWSDYLQAERYEDAGRLLEQTLATYGGESIDTVKSLLIQLFGSRDEVFAADSGSNRLMQLCKSEDMDEIRHIGLSLLQELSGREAGGQAEAERKVIKQAKQFVKANAGSEIMLQDVANHVYLNPVYLSRLFKLETGMSFSDYVTETRMSQAAQLLRDTNLKIYEICEKSGYKDVRHFYKLFKQYAGCSPSEYRERAD
ncbi:Response regulator containing CheY-like receiver domain and AraC-type DNA-binding domain [Paenibacillus sp. UNCCL117]|uniref:helix-turn-helix domain-containing protein n=1 Tax=unclassified Paenibacillus TaxID=185978 RepID=UPI000885C6EE|nr:MULTISPECIES: helix-turn-helix domain-containing protein [unclassified Paenibacillus]SDE55465.1 Helix-turn-helix domain-containing protein [Paenibacillus sp. cl123]SFW66436.1 Response regulator containing CheY-like receiver domain and AraC-type DNA-binding domain [Paenibacillus sp. UNCCL117]